MEPSTTTGRKGSLENPEVHEDVPGHVIPILRREFDDFDNEAEKYLAGETEETEFIGFRLKQGVYGQRQPEVQMVRVKLPFGGVSPDQMDAFASVVEKYAPLKKGHITTRQNIQIHHVPLRDAAALIRELSDAGLSSREGCGNTVRNVTADPWAGVCHDELWDPTPYVGAYVRYFVRHQTTQLMPRKVKTAFTGSDTDRALTGIHDIAFIARERDGVRGFEIRVGGGTSIMPRVAPTLVDFVTAEDGEYLKWAEAVFRIFDRQDWLRVNRARARIKVLVDKVGIDAVREMVDEELRGDWVAERGYARTTVHQNIVLRWVRDEAVYDVWRRLGELGLGDAGSDEINDVVSCPGTDSCKLGITSSMGLNHAIRERIESMRIEDPVTKRIHHD